MLVIGPVDRTGQVAAQMGRAFGSRNGGASADLRLAAIDTQVLACASTDAGLPALSEQDLIELEDTLPLGTAVKLLKEMRGEEGIAFLAGPSLGRVVPFWNEAARLSGSQVAALLVVSSARNVGGGAAEMLSWLQNMLLAERATRGMLHRKVIIDAAAGDKPEVIGAQWISSTWNFSADCSTPAVAPVLAEGEGSDPSNNGVGIGFNSWIRRCEAAFGQLARQGESEAIHRELDRIRASFDTAMALFGAMLGEGKLAAERLQLKNNRLRAKLEELEHADIDDAASTLTAEVRILKAEADEREADLTAARGDLAMLRAWCDDIGSRSVLAHAKLLDTRLKFGSVTVANDRMVQALVAHGERQLQLVEKPLWRWIARRGWGFKAARRLVRHLAIIENFLDEMPWPIVGIHPEGRRRRILAYLTGAKDFLPDFPFVQDLEYGEMYPDVPQSGMRPLVHFILHGQGELRNPHPLFDTAHYLRQCPEAMQIAPSAVVHYLRWGKDKGHDPHPLFSTQGYLQRYPDTSELNSLVHWIEHYRNVANPLFDPQYYLESYPDVADAGRNPLTHYLAIGWREGRNPNPWFDTRYYLAANPQVGREGQNPLVHYALTGWRQRVRTSPQFDPAFYLAADPALCGDCDPLRHYIEHGRAEGRATTSGEPAPSVAVAVAEPPLPPAIPLSTETSGYANHRVSFAVPARAGRVVLMVEALYPRPDLDSGSLDHVNFARIFQRLGYEVHYLSLLEFGRDHDDRTGHYRTQMEEMGVHCVTAKDYAYFEGYYFDIADRIDICFVSRVHFGGMQIESLRQLCPHARIIFNTVDLHFVREEREGALKNDPALIVRARRTREMELDFAAQADATVVVSSSEKLLLDELAPEARTHVVPLIRQFEDLREGAFSQRRDIAFIGGFNHQPNIDAIEHFLKDIWPHVRRRRPDIGFRVIGANMPDGWARRKEAGVTFVGFVEDLDGELARLRLTVAPLRYGAGAKGKLVSSLAAGVPAVVSAIASEGMGLLDGETVLVADSGETFAENIIRLHDDETLWSTLSRNGAAFIRSAYSIDTGYKIMREILTQVSVTPPVDTKNAG